MNLYEISLKIKLFRCRRYFIYNYFCSVVGNNDYIVEKWETFATAEFRQRFLFFNFFHIIIIISYYVLCCVCVYHQLTFARGYCPIG